MQDALKDIFGPMFEAMLQGEMNSHLGYSNNERGEKETVNRRNGYTKKTLKTTVGDVPIEVPRDREGTFEPVVVPKRKRDVSAIQSMSFLDTMWMGRRVFWVCGSAASRKVNING